MEMSQEHTERFWSRVDKKGEDECWNWTSYTRMGYGRFQIKKQKIDATHVAYESVHGKLPKGMMVLHKCDNPLCVNPKHLFAGTHADNTKDMMQKGRAGHGEVFGKDNPASKLDEDKVREIRKLTKEGWSQRKLAKKYGVRQSQIWMILHQLTWKWVK